MKQGGIPAPSCHLKCISLTLAPLAKIRDFSQFQFLQDRLSLKVKRNLEINTFSPDTTSNSTVSPSPTLRKNFLGLFLLMAV